MSGPCGEVDCGALVVCLEISQQKCSVFSPTWKVAMECTYVNLCQLATTPKTFQILRKLLKSAVSAQISITFQTFKIFVVMHPCQLPFSSKCGDGARHPFLYARETLFFSFQISDIQFRFSEQNVQISATIKGNCGNYHVFPESQYNQYHWVIFFEHEHLCIDIWIESNS